MRGLLPGVREVNRISNAERMRPAAIAAAILFVCLPAASAFAQRNAPPPRMRFAQAQAARRQNQPQRQYQNQQRPYQNQQRPYQNQQRPNQNQQRPYQGQGQGQPGNNGARP